MLHSVICWSACTVFPLGRFTLAWHVARLAHHNCSGPIKKTNEACAYHVTQRAERGALRQAAWQTTKRAEETIRGWLESDHMERRGRGGDLIIKCNSI